MMLRDTKPTFVCQECGADLESVDSPHAFDDCRQEWPRLRAEIERLRVALRMERVDAHDIERLRAAIRLALQYMTAGGHKYIATADDAQAAVDTLLAALAGPKDG